MQYKWTVLSNTTLGTVMASLDMNIVLISLPTIARELPNTSILDLLFAAGNLAIFMNALARGAVTFVLVFYLQGPTMRLNPFLAICIIS